MHEISKIQATRSKQEADLTKEPSVSTKKLIRSDSFSSIQMNISPMVAKSKRNDIPVVLSPTGILNKLDIWKNNWWVNKARRLKEDIENKQARMRK